MKKLAIMQPYFLPYIGYFQLINIVDKFILYDNIEYSKKGWVNRNRILMNGIDKMFTIPLRKDSDFLDINKRYLSHEFLKKKEKILHQIKNSYRKSPFFDSVFPLIQEIFLYQDENLFEYIWNSIIRINKYLEITTEIIRSSTVEIDHKSKKEEKIIQICENFNVKEYINAIGGIDLYSKEVFRKRGIKIKYLKSMEIKYKQFNNEFIPWLSIIDVMMFNSRTQISKFLNEYEFI